MVCLTKDFHSATGPGRLIEEYTLWCKLVDCVGWDQQQFLGFLTADYVGDLRWHL